MRADSITRRTCIAVAMGIALTAGYVGFLIAHFTPRTTPGTPVQDPLLPWEQAWLTWLAGPRDAAPRAPDGAEDIPHARALFAALAGDDSELSALPPESRALTIFLLRKALTLSSTVIQEEPIVLDDTDQQLLPLMVKSRHNGLFGTQAASAILAGTIKPGPEILTWARTQASAVLSRGWRAEGYALLQQLAPYLASKDPEFDGWLGSAQVMQALDSDSGISKIASVNRGSATLDNAIALAPTNLVCRYIRAQTYLSLPDFFEDLRTIGIADLAVIADWLDRGIIPSTTGEDMKQEAISVDPVYLFSVVSWAKERPGLSGTARRRLADIARRVSAHTQGIP